MPKLSLINVWDCLRHMLGETRATGSMHRGCASMPRTTPGQVGSPGYSRILERGALSKRRKKEMLTGLGICTALCLGSPGLFGITLAGAMARAERALVSSELPLMKQHLILPGSSPKMWKLEIGEKIKCPGGLVQEWRFMWGHGTAAPLWQKIFGHPAKYEVFIGIASQSSPKPASGKPHGQCWPLVQAGGYRQSHLVWLQPCLCSTKEGNSPCTTRTQHFH